MNDDPVSNLRGRAGAGPWDVSTGVTVEPIPAAKVWGIAYLSDPVAVNGAGTLFTQKRAIERYAATHGVSIRGYRVDAGRHDGPGPLAHALSRLMVEAKTGDIPVVLVEHVSRFADDYAVALRVAAALSSWGTEVHEARGGLAVIDRSVATLLSDVPAGSVRRSASHRAAAAARRVAVEAI